MEKNITYSLGNQNRKRPEITTNLLKVPVSINFCHNTDDKNIDMKLKSSCTNTMFYTTTAAVYEKPADKIEKESPNN